MQLYSICVWWERNQLVSDQSSVVECDSWNSTVVQSDAEGFAMVEAYLDACAPTSPPPQVLWFIPTVEEHAHPLHWRIELSLLNCEPCDDPASGFVPARGSNSTPNPSPYPAKVCFSKQERRLGSMGWVALFSLRKKINEECPFKLIMLM